jgi:hypothetical protein
MRCRLTGQREKPTALVLLVFEEIMFFAMTIVENAVIMRD